MDIRSFGRIEIKYNSTYSHFTQMRIQLPKIKCNKYKTGKIIKRFICCIKIIHVNIINNIMVKSFK